MITYRPITDDDKGFLATLYASTREEEMRPVPWPDEEKAKFLFSQFEAQRILDETRSFNSELVASFGTS